MQLRWHTDEKGRRLQWRDEGVMWQEVVETGEGKVEKEEVKITEADCIGMLEGFPVEVVRKMVSYQEVKDVGVFQKYIKAHKVIGGFDWLDTCEGGQFWMDVVLDKKFDVFFERYPKEVKKEYPRVMAVSNDEKDWHKRVVFMEKNGKFIAWNCAENLEQAKSYFWTSPWLYAREVEEEIVDNSLTVNIKVDFFRNSKVDVYYFRLNGCKHKFCINPISREDLDAMLILNLVRFGIKIDKETASKIHYKKETPC